MKRQRLVLVVLFAVLAVGCDSRITYRLIDGESNRPLALHHVRCYRESRGTAIRGTFDTDVDGRLSEVVTRKGDTFFMTPHGYGRIAVKVADEYVLVVSPAERLPDGSNPQERRIPFRSRDVVTLPAFPAMREVER